MEETRKIVLFEEEENHVNLLPLSFTRPVSAFRVGILTIEEKWRRMFAGDYCIRPVEYLRGKFCGCTHDGPDVWHIAGNVLPDRRLVKQVESLQPGESLVDQAGRLVAFRGTSADFGKGMTGASRRVEGVASLQYVFDVFLNNGEQIKSDFGLLTEGRKSCPLPEGNRLIGSPVDENGNPTLFIEEGAKIECAVINVKEGPVYIGRDASVMEMSALRGPLALCERAKVRMGTKVYGGCTFGPYCKVGGEVDNVVMFGYSNKAHDGYLGNAVIGEWCNIGAGTNASNLKNDYSKIRIWNYASRRFMKTDLQFCGLIMGDHSKTGVNCMFNTATVLGVGVNVHGSGFPRVFVPSFSEGSATSGFSDVPMKKFYDIAERVMSRRGISFTDDDRAIYERVREVASRFKQ